jgi:hypothetical protein
MLLCVECYENKAYTLSIVRHLQRWIVCMPLSVNLFVTLFFVMAWICKALYLVWSNLLSGTEFEPAALLARPFKASQLQEPTLQIQYKMLSYLLQHGSKADRLYLPSALAPVLFSGYPSTPTMKTIWSSETSVYFQQTTCRCITEGSTLNNHRCDNFIS